MPGDELEVLGVRRLGLGEAAEQRERRGTPLLRAGQIGGLGVKERLLCGIRVRHWLAFFKSFQETQDDGRIHDALTKLTTIGRPTASNSSFVRTKQREEQASFRQPDRTDAQADSSEKDKLTISLFYKGGFPITIRESFAPNDGISRASCLAKTCTSSQCRIFSSSGARPGWHYPACVRSASSG